MGTLRRVNLESAPKIFILHHRIQRGYALNCFEVRCTGFFHIMENRISTLSNSSHSKMKDASPWYPPVPAPRLKPGEATEAFISNIAEAEAGSEKQKNLILFLLSQILHHHHHLAATKRFQSVSDPIKNLTFSSSARGTHVIRAAKADIKTPERWEIDRKK